MKLNPYSHRRFRAMVEAIVGAGSTMTRDIPPYAIAAGVPARVIRYRPGAPEPAKT